MLENETAARQGGRNLNSQVEGKQSSGSHRDLQPSPARSARIARALRLRIYHLLRERAADARYLLDLEQWCIAEQQRVLDEISYADITLRRMRSLVHSLEFEGEVAP